MPESKNGSAEIRDWAPLLEFLRHGAKVEKLKESGKICLRNSQSMQVISVASLGTLVRHGLLKRLGTRVELTEAGQNLVPGGNGNAGERLEIQRQSHGFVSRNRFESPLDVLHWRKGLDGRTFLDDLQFDAGERLRCDFTHAGMAPKLNGWQTIASKGRSTYSFNNSESITVSMIAARQRFEAAVSSLGPDLSGVVTDICCFLKGLEQVEAERHWPRRSAKFMLRAGLSVLAIHYSPPVQENRRHPLHWGASDYKPEAR